MSVILFDFDAVVFIKHHDFHINRREAVVVTSITQVIVDCKILTASRCVILGVIVRSRIETDGGPAVFVIGLSPMTTWTVTSP